MTQHHQLSGNPRMSRHAATRGQQRGIKPSMVSRILMESDVDLHAGGGCRTYFVSKKRLAQLERTCPHEQAFEKLNKIAVVWSELTGEVVTVLRHAARSGRRYRRQAPTRKARDAGRFI